MNCIKVLLFTFTHISLAKASHMDVTSRVERMNQKYVVNFISQCTIVIDPKTRR